MSILNDAMYSDSPYVVDALAELIECTVITNDARATSEGRMAQVRHILQVDEASFRASFGADQLKTIECKEMEDIVMELVSAVGIQRFRFVERQNKGGSGSAAKTAAIHISHVDRQVTMMSAAI